MDFISALIETKNGKKIRNTMDDKSTIYRLNNGILEYFQEGNKGWLKSAVSLDNHATYDWEVVKEPVIYELECIWNKDDSTGLIYPTLIKGPSLSKSINSLINKKTKLKIEVIEE